MSLADVTSPPMTAEEFLCLADDDEVERDLIRGELREWPMTRRNPMHGESESLIGHYLWAWIMSRPRPWGKVLSGESSFRLKGDPVTFVGIDVAYVSAEMAALHGRRRKFYEGPLVLAVEILSPSDQHERIVEKVETYLEAGVVVWVVDPDFRTVAVHRPGEPPVVYNETQELDGEPYLPGFRVAVARLFEG
jgi:Uma2 family endonuclease